MKNRRHWTVYVVCTVVLLTIVSGAVLQFVRLKDSRFESSIAEAGGAVIYHETFSRSFDFGGVDVDLFYRKPIAVEISSGSHPIPESVGRLKSMKSVKKLSLNTSSVGDYLVPTLSTFRHVTTLDLTETEISAGAVIQILEALPGLNKFHLSRENFSEGELSLLLVHRFSSKLIFSGPSL